MEKLKAGTSAPDFTLRGLDGRRYSLQEALARGPVLVAFFKVSCPTCQYAFPYLDRLHHQFLEQGVQVWAVSQDNAKNSNSFAEEFGLKFPILIDEHPYDVSDAYGLRFVPTLFLVNAQGLIELSSDGFDRKDFLAIQQWFGRYYSISPPALFLPAERVPEFKPG